MSDNKASLGGYFSIAAGFLLHNCWDNIFRLPEIQRGSSVFRDIKNYLSLLRLNHPHWLFNIGFLV